MTRLYHFFGSARNRYSGFARVLSFLMVASLGLVTGARAQVTRTFTAGGTFTVPSGVTSITVEAWGGGGGCGATNGRDGGGGGGAYASSTISVVPGVNYNVVIGGGGDEGDDGGNSSFNPPVGASIVVAAGGSSTNANNNGSPGGTVAASTGTIRRAGGAGGNAGSNTGGGGGGSATAAANGTNGTNGGALGGAGGAGEGAGGKGADNTFGSNGANGNVPGGGGGGDSDAFGSDGGSGARGEVRITYTCPSATISYSGSPFCLSIGSTNVVLTGSTGGTYSAAPAGLNINSTTGAINPSASTPGTYTVTYNIPASGAGAYTCTAVNATTSVTVSPNVTAGTVTGASPLCISGTATYTSTGTAGGAWSSNAPLVATVDPVTGLVTAVGPGVANITYSVNSGCGSPVSNFATVTVNPNVSAGTVSGTSPLCVGAPATFSSNGTAGGNWSSTNTAAATVDANTGQVTTVAAGTTNIVYTLNSGCGSPVFSQSALTVNALPTASISGSGTYCTGSSTTTSLSIAVTGTGPWSGTLSDGTPFSGASSPISVNVSPVNTTTYTIATLNDANCTGTSFSGSALVTVIPTPTVNDPADQLLCNATASTAVTFTGSAGADFSWTNNNTSIGLGAGGVGNIPSFTAANTSTTNQNIAVITVTPHDTVNGVACAGTPQTFNITVQPESFATISGASNTQICADQGASANINVSGGTPFTGMFNIAVETAPGVFGTPVPYGPFTVVTPGSSAVAIASSALPNNGSTTLKYRVSWLSLIDANNCGATPLTGFVDITVNPLPVIAVSAAPTGNVCPGTNVSFTVSETNNVGGTFNWEAHDANNTLLGSGNNVAYAAGVNTTLAALGSCPASIVNPVTFTFTPVGPITLNCQGDPLTRQVNVMDTTKPVWSTVAANLDRTVSCSDASGLTAAQALFPAATDNCDNDVSNIVKVTGIFVAGSCPQSGTYTNTWTVTDNCGNISDVYTQVINIVDTAAPTWTTAAANLDRTVSCSDAAGLAAAQALLPVSSDNCDMDVSDIVKVSGVFVSGSCPQAGTYTNTWTSTDNCGNVSDTFTQVINIVDTAAPTWTTVASALDVTVSCSDAAGLVAAQALLPVSSDNCDMDVSDIVKVSGAFVAGSCPQAGTYTNTWTSTDNCGNVSDTFTQVINIVDTAAPSWTTAAGNLDVTLSCSDAAGLTAAQALFPVAADNCDGDVTNVMKTTGAFVAGSSCPQAGTYTNDWTVTDACGNISAVYTQVITIIDTTAPAWTTVAGDLDRTVACKTGTAFNNAQALFPVAGDNCDLDVTNVVKTTGAFVPDVACAEEGTFTNTWTVTDACGNISAMYTQVITVENDDFVLPANSGSTVACAADAVAPALPSVTDNCGNVLTPSAPVISTAPSCEGTMTYTYTYTDCEGNSHDWVYTYTIDDNLKPVLVAPPTQTLNVGAGVNCTVLMPDYRSLINATDNCGGSVTLVQLAPNEPASDVIGYGGTRTIKIKGTDCAGNTDTVSFTLVLVDSTAPVAISQPVTVYLNAAGNASITAAMVNNGSHDNCSPVTLSVSPTTFNCTNVGSGNIATLTVKDAWMNTSTVTAVVTVVDTVKPVITTCAPNITVGKGPLCTNELLNYTSLVVADDFCGIDTIMQSPLPGTIIAALVPTVPVTLTVKDVNGNTSTCTFTITYVDTTAPVITGCPSDITVGNAVGMCNNTVTWTVPVATDNCTDIGPVVLTATHNPGDVFPKGTTVVTYTATDAANNVTTCSFNVTVNDTEAPVLNNCPGTVTVNTGAGATTCDATATWTEPGATDNCNASANLIWTKSHTPGSVFSVGTTQVTYTATDSSGNISAVCSFDVVVVDNTAPVFTSCPVNINSNTNAVDCKANVLTPDPQVTDNCMPVTTLTWIMTGATTAASPMTGINNLGTHIFEIGTTTVSYTATDASGNIATCSYNVTVVNNLQGAIAGTSTVSQNTNTTSNITFIGSGGTLPYTFVYTVNGGAQQTISTTGANTIVTVPQSNAVLGDFIYTLVSVTDANGCTGALQADNSDTIKVVLVVPAADMIPNLVVTTPLFTPTNNSRAYTLDVYNIGVLPTTGTITIYVIKPTAAFSLSFNETSTWSVSDFGTYYELTGSPVINVNGSSTITGMITTSPSVSNGTSTISVIVNPGSGGETNSSNNSVNAVLNVTN